MNLRLLNHRKTLFALTAIMVIVVLYFGLKPKGYRGVNNVHWLTGQAGIHIDHFGHAFAPLSDAYPASSTLSLEVAFQSNGNQNDRFKILLSVHSGKDEEQLLIGQWRSWLIVMNGDDYDGRKGVAKLSVKEVFLPEKVRHLVITSGEDETRIYMDGKLAAAKKGLRLAIPAAGENRVMVLGNSVYGHHTWTGRIFGVGVYSKDLSPGDVQERFQQWRERKQIVVNPTIAPDVLYSFTDRKGLKAADQTGAARDLVIPRFMSPLKKRFLSQAWHKTRFDTGFFTDVSVNLIGFVPLGFLLVVYLSAGAGSRNCRPIVLATLFCFLLSFFIESAQAWMPSRSSQLLDLILNTLGGAAGGMMGSWQLKTEG